MIHEIKCHTVYFDKVIESDLRKRKTVEIRRNDRGYNVEDVLILEDWNPDTNTSTGRGAQVLVTHIVGAPWMEDGMVAMSILLQDFWNKNHRKEVLATESNNPRNPSEPERDDQRQQEE